MRKKNNTQSTSLFNDENNYDSPTPEHDKIHMWLNDNLETICSSLILAKLADRVPKLKYNGVIENRWEFPVMRSGYRSYENIVVGYIDLYAKVSHEAWRNAYTSEVTRENIPGHVVNTESLLLFEIKPTIRSLGAVIRQINLYKEYQKGSYFIVSPDATHKRILQEQNIGFIQYPRYDIKTAEFI